MKRAPQGRYTREFRQEAVKLVLEENLSLPEAGRRLSLPPSTLGYWVKLYKAGKLGDVGKSYRPLDRRGDGARPDEERTGGSEDGAGHPKKSSRVLCQGVAARYAMMKQLRLDYPTSVLSRMLVVSASGYYAWVDRPPSKRAREEVRLELEIKAAHKRTRQTYGPERLQRDLAEHGVRVGIGRIKRIRKKLGIRCKQKRRFKATTQSRHRLSVAENVLGQQFKVYRPNAVWVTDITYVPHR